MFYILELAQLLLIVVYFVLLHFVSPALVRKGDMVLWWLIIIGILLCSFALSIQALQLADGTGKKRITRQGIVVLGICYVLLGLTLFLYDPTINPHLRVVGLSRAWIISLMALFGWVIYAYKTLRKTK